MKDFDAKPSSRARLGIAIGVALLHLIVLAGLIRAFAPDLISTVSGSVVQAFDVRIAPPEKMEQPTPAPSVLASPREEGAAAPAGKKATPKAVAALPAPVVLSSQMAPPVPGAGNANSAGASAAGVGTGAGGVGAGLGAGRSGSGTGGGGQGSKAVKIAGDIVSARDYPSKTRDLRLGSSVTIMLTVTQEGRVDGCRIARPSADPEADRITCRLATERFRFKPALNASGQPIESIYGWQQRWFTPASK